MTEPTEWVMVPREPTPEMIEAGGYALKTYLKNLSKDERDKKHPNHPIAENVWGRQFERSHKAKIRWSAMLAAAPSPPSSPNMEVVREWEEYRDQAEFDTRELGDHMAAALTAQAQEHEADTHHIARLVKETVAQAKTIEGLERQIEIRKQAAARHQVCSGHSGKQPTDGECIMCFAERHEAVRNRLDAKHELDRWKEESEATVTELRAEVADLKKFESDAIQEGIEEAKADADNFDKDLWVTVRKIMSARPSFDWENYRDQGVTIQDVFDFFHEEFTALDKDHARATAAEAEVERLTGEVERLSADNQKWRTVYADHLKITTAGHDTWLTERCALLARIETVESLEKSVRASWREAEEEVDRESARATTAEAEVERLTGLMQERGESFYRTLAKIEAERDIARAALRDLLAGYDRWSTMIPLPPDMQPRIVHAREALAALPSPTLPTIRGEG